MNWKSGNIKEINKGSPKYFAFLKWNHHVMIFHHVGKLFVLDIQIDI